MKRAAEPIDVAERHRQDLEAEQVEKLVQRVFR